MHINPSHIGQKESEIIDNLQLGSLDEAVEELYSVSAIEKNEERKFRGVQIDLGYDYTAERESAIRSRMKKCEQKGIIQFVRDHLPQPVHTFDELPDPGWM